MGGKRYGEQLEIAISHLSHRGKLQPEVITGNPAYSRVRLSALAEWVKTMGWDIPEGLAALAEPPALPSKASEDSSSDLGTWPKRFSDFPQ